MSMETVTQAQMLDGFYLQNAAIGVMPYAGDSSHILAASPSAIPIAAACAIIFGMPGFYRRDGVKTYGRESLYEGVIPEIGAGICVVGLDDEAIALAASECAERGWEVAMRLRMIAEDPYVVVSVG